MGTHTPLPKIITRDFVCRTAICYFQDPFLAFLFSYPPAAVATETYIYEIGFLSSSSFFIFFVAFLKSSYLNSLSRVTPNRFALSFSISQLFPISIYHGHLFFIRSIKGHTSFCYFHLNCSPFVLSMINYLFAIESCFAVTKCEATVYNLMFNKYSLKYEDI